MIYQIIFHAFFSFIFGFLIGQICNRLDFSEQKEKFFFQKEEILHYLFSKYYFLGNVLLSFFFLLIGYKNFSIFFTFLFFLFLISFYLISVIDFKVCLIPDTLQIVVLTLSCLYIQFIKDCFLSRISISIIVVLLFYLIYYTLDYFKKEEWIGFADIKLFGSTTLCIDWNLLPLFFFLIGVCGVISHFLCGRQKHFPFAPSILLVTLFFILFSGNKMFNIFIL